MCENGIGYDEREREGEGEGWRLELRVEASVLHTLYISFYQSLHLFICLYLEIDVANL